MQVLIRSAAAAALVVALSLPAAARKSTVRLGGDIVPVHQSVHLRLDPDAPDYEGSVAIELDVRRETDVIRLHAEGLEIDAAALVGTPTELTVDREADDVIRLYADPPVRAGKHRLEIDFRGEYGGKSTGLYRTLYEGSAYLFTQFQADDAREAFPCFDEPSFKIPFDMTLTVPEQHLAVSNTPASSQRVTDGWRTTTFARTPPLPSYLLAVAVGPLETVEVPGMSVPGRIIFPKGKGHLTELAVEMTPRILAALEEWFDSPHPYPKLDQIAVPEFWPGAMENAGAITYKDRILLLDPETATVGQKRRMAHVIAHEIAHQWYGNLVTTTWWDDLWLNEAFADWMAGKITDRVYPEFRHTVSELQDTQANMAGDARPSTHPIRRPILSTERLMEGVGLTYAKGRTVLGMFENWIGEETFRQGVLNYIQENKWGNAVAADLWRALDDVSEFEVSASLAGFLEQPGFPLLRAERTGDRTVRLSQTRFHNYGIHVEPLEWRLPVVLKYSAGGKPYTRRVVLDGPSREFTLEADAPVEWIYPNGGATGYYRWVLAGDELAALAAASPEVLTVRERVEFVGNLAGLLDAGAVDGATFARTLAGLRNETDPLVLGALVSSVGKVRSSFVTPDLEGAFSVWIHAALSPALDRLGRDPREGEDPAMGLVRPDLIAALADWGRDADLRAWSRGQAERYLAGEKLKDPAVTGTVLRVAAYEGDADLAERYREHYLAAATPVEAARMVAAMASFRDRALREQFLAWALTNLRPDQLGAAYGALTSTDEGRDQYLEFVQDNFATMAGAVPEFMVAMFPYLGGGCSETRLDNAVDFFGDEERAVTGTANSVDRVTDQVSDCVSLRNREGESVAAYLRGFAARAGGENPPRSGADRAPQPASSGSPQPNG